MGKQVAGSWNTAEEAREAALHAWERFKEARPDAR